MTAPRRSPIERLARIGLIASVLGRHREGAGRPVDPNDEPLEWLITGSLRARSYPRVAILAPLAFSGDAGIPRYQRELVTRMAGRMDLFVLTQSPGLSGLRGDRIPEALRKSTPVYYGAAAEILRHAAQISKSVATNRDVLAIRPSVASIMFISRILQGVAVDAAEVDLLHATANYLPRTRGRCRRVVTVHDTIPLEVPEHCSPANCRAFLQKGELRREDHVIVVSRASLEKFNQAFDHPPEATHVVFPGVDLELFRPGGGGAPHPRSTPYLLSVGRIEPRKNLVRALQAFEILARRHPSLEWVIVGVRSHGWAGFAPHLAASPVRTKVHLLGKVGDERLAQLYRGASALLYPSLSEGFGSPIVEGLASGIPVAASDLPAIRESGGDAVVRLDPLDVSSIVEAAEKAAFDQAGAAVRREIGIEHTRQFGWDRTVQGHLDVYADTLGTDVDRLLYA